jgi:hypothetical protein
VGSGSIAAKGKDQQNDKSKDTQLPDFKVWHQWQRLKQRLENRLPKPKSAGLTS